MRLGVPSTDLYVLHSHSSSNAPFRIPETQLQPPENAGLLPLSTAPVKGYDVGGEFCGGLLSAFAPSLVTFPINSASAYGG